MVTKTLFRFENHMNAGQWPDAKAQQFKPTISSIIESGAIPWRMAAVYTIEDAVKLKDSIILKVE